jgi:hypothetical protein
MSNFPSPWRPGIGDARRASIIGRNRRPVFLTWQSTLALSMPALIVRKKIVPLNAKIEGPYIGLTLTLNAAHTWNVSRCGGPSPFHSNGGGAFTLICAPIGGQTRLRTPPTRKKWRSPILGLVYCYITTFDVPIYGGRARIVI